MLVRNLHSALMLCYIGFFLANAFFPAIFLQAGVVTAAGLIFIVSFPALRRSTQIISIFLTAIGFALLFTYQATTTDWLRAGSHNASIISLVLTVPLLGTILHFEPYQLYLSAVASRYVTSPYRFYVATSLLVAILSALLNIASFHFVHQLLHHISGRFPAKLFNNAMFRGFLPNMMWSPSYISLALAIQYTNTSWFSIVPLGATLATTGVLVGLLIGWFEYGRLCIPPAMNEPSETEPRTLHAENAGLIKLVAQIVALIVFIILLELVTHKSALVIVPFVAIAGPLVLAVCYRKIGVYREQCLEFYKNRLPRLHNELVLFTAVGFFGYALGLSDIPGYIPSMVSRMGLDTPVSLVLLIFMSIFLLSLVGVHPMITIAALAAAFPLGSIPLSPKQLAGTYLSAYMSYAALSPFSAVNMVFGSLSKQNPLTVGLKQNGKFALVFSVLALVIILTVPM